MFPIYHMVNIELHLNYISIFWRLIFLMFLIGMTL